jgi:hypothetical protein
VGWGKINSSSRENTGMLRLLYYFYFASLYKNNKAGSAAFDFDPDH